jgi:glycosyltransferase involved in cell wall biosynthesis
MIHLFINALAASAGGGLTYVRNVVPHIAARDDVRATVLLDSRLRLELQPAPNISFVEPENSPGTLRRAWFEQYAVRDLIRRSGANVLLSAGNFALWNSPAPQILLSRNSLYTSQDFLSDVRSRGEYRLWIDTRLKGALARFSIRIADCVVAPSEAFAEELRQWTGKQIIAIHHGFDRKAFVQDRSPLPVLVREKLESAGDSLRLLFVSHYNYYRNFETLLRALPLIKEKLRPRCVRLFLTCRLASGANPGAYRPDFAAALVHELGLSREVVELDSVPYPLLHHLYKAAHIYVTPAYAESFAHPLVEAMSSGLPVVASDLPVQREICGAAGSYFSRFSSPELAERVCEVARSPQLAVELAQRGVERSALFSWRLHVERILSLAGELVSAGNQ